MKKLMKSFLSIMLVIAVLISGAFGVSVSAVSGSCVEHHFEQFENLVPTGEYVPENIDDTCAYVAMSMMLSFYDYYWNDRFVPTVINSDGTTHEMGWNNGTYYSNIDKLTTFTAKLEYDAYYAWESSHPGASYDDFVDANLNNFLHPYLVSIEQDLWYQQGALEMDLGTYYWDMITVLEKYLYEVRGFTEDEVTVEFLMGDDETLFAKMEEVIGNGFPLMYCGGNVDVDIEDLKFSSNGIDDIVSGHVMIAYKVEENNGEKDIKLHTGWNLDYHYDADDRVQWVNTTEYKFLNGIIWLEINEVALPHQHSYHYVDLISGETLCSCQIYSEHPAHESNHMYFNEYDSANHYQICHCGEKINIEAHSIEYIYYTSIQHQERCSQCSYSRVANHTYNIATTPTAEGHSLACACGVVSSTTQSHNEDNYISRGGLIHNVYCECGYLIRSAPHQMVSNGLKNVCSDCDYVGDNGILPPGIIIKGIEDESDTITE